jgi:cell division protein FtsB
MAENKRLRRDLEIIGTDEYIERIAREKLGMVKRDELVFEDINK